MTATQDSSAVVCGRTVGSRPPWVAGAFPEMYPDSISTSVAATVLATGEDWDWIAAREQEVGAAIEQTITDKRSEDGQWLVCQYAVGGDDFVVATRLEDIDSRRGSVGAVVLVATATTIEAHAAATVRR